MTRLARAGRLWLVATLTLGAPRPGTATDGTAGAAEPAENAAPIAPAAAAERIDPAADGGSAEPAARLERLQREVAARRARVEAFARQEQGLLDTLDGIDRAAERITGDVSVARRKVRAAESAQAATQRELARLEEQMAGTRRTLASGMVRLYREGRGRVLRLLAGAESLRDLLDRARAVRRAVEQDAALLARARSESEALGRARAEALTSARAGAEAIRLHAERAHALEEERAVKQEILVGLRLGGARERSSLAEIEAAARALEETLGRLGTAPLAHAAPAAPFTSLRGRLRAPVVAPIARSFGRVVNAEFRTATFRKGIDFTAPAGTPVRAVAAGEVRFAGWFRGYGKMVIVDHGEGYFTVCAHLDEIQVAVGEAVQADRPVGTVGDTGSLAGPLLYFEIRRGSEPLDPSRWLAGGTGLE